MKRVSQSETPFFYSFDLRSSSLAFLLKDKG
jgi:hypothetical protein